MTNYTFFSLKLHTEANKELKINFNQDTNDDFINKIVKVTWDAQKGEWAYSIDEDFLNSLGIEGTSNDW